MISDLTALITEYLAERKQTSDSGWPEVTIEEQQALFQIIEGLIHAKYGVDADRDPPLYTILVDYTKERHPYRSIPHYATKKFADCDAKHFSDCLRLAKANLSIAENEIELVSDLFSMWVMDTQEVR